MDTNSSPPPPYIIRQGWRDKEERMRHHLYSTEQLWELGWNARTCTMHIIAIFTEITPTNTQTHIPATSLSYLHSSRVHCLVLWESQLPWQNFAYLSFPFCLLLWLHAFICQACVCIPTYVSSSVAKASARDTDGTQMETDSRADQCNTALHTLSLTFFFCLRRLSFSRVKLSTSLTISFALFLSAVARIAFKALLLSLNLCPLSCSLSQALSLPPSQSLSLASSSSSIFPHIGLSSVFMGLELLQRHKPSPPLLQSTSPHPFPHGS